jgi:hypothetical protein
MNDEDKLLQEVDDFLNGPGYSSAISMDIYSTICDLKYQIRDEKYRNTKGDVFCRWIINLFLLSSKADIGEQEERFKNNQQLIDEALKLASVSDGSSSIKAEARRLINNLSSTLARYSSKVHTIDSRLYLIASSGSYRSLTVYERIMYCFLGVSPRKW